MLIERGTIGHWLPPYSLVIEADSFCMRSEYRLTSLDRDD